MDKRPAAGLRRGLAGMKGQLTVVALVASVMASIDYVSYNWLIPWGDEMTTNHTMSLGYIVAFFVVFCNFIMLFALIAHLFQKDSYESDEWQ